MHILFFVGGRYYFATAVWIHKEAIPTERGTMPGFIQGLKVCTESIWRKTAIQPEGLRGDFSGAVTCTMKPEEWQERKGSLGRAFWVRENDE